MVNKKALNPSRAIYYGALSKLLVFKNNDDRFFALKEALPILAKNALDENSKEAFERLYVAFDLYGEEIFQKEFDAIFYLPGNKTVRTTASYFEDGIEGGKKQLEVKNFLAKTKIRRDENNYKESEDSIGFLLVFMNELIELVISGHEEYDFLQHCLFTEIINPFIDTFSNELFNHPKSDLYKDVAIVLNSFMEFERLYFEAPKHSIVNIKENSISMAESARRASNKAAKERERTEKVKN